MDHVPTWKTVGYVRGAAATLNEVRRSRSNGVLWPMTARLKRLSLHTCSYTSIIGPLRQRSPRCNDWEVPTRALGRRGSTLPQIGNKRSYDRCATSMAQCCLAARMARVWCFHIWSLQLTVVQPSHLHYREFLSLGAQSCSFLRVCRTLLADVAAALLFPTSTHPFSKRVSTSSIFVATTVVSAVLPLVT